MVAMAVAVLPRMLTLGHVSRRINEGWNGNTYKHSRKVVLCTPQNPRPHERSSCCSNEGVADEWGDVKQMTHTLWPAVGGQTERSNRSCAHDDGRSHSASASLAWKKKLLKPKNLWATIQKNILNPKKHLEPKKTSWTHHLAKHRKPKWS